MTKPIFDHDRLDVYRLSIEYVSLSFAIAKQLAGAYRHARDQWLRAAQSIPLNVAEGNGKRSLKDRSRFLDIARGSALECVAIQDVLATTDGLNHELHDQLKRMLRRIVSMLTRLIARSDVVAGHRTEYNADVMFKYEYEYRGLSTNTTDSIKLRLPDLPGKYNGTFQRAAFVFIFPQISAKGHRFSRATPAVNH